MTGVMGRASANILLTLFFPVLPLLVYCVLRLDTKQRSPRRIVTRFLFTGLTVPSFYLFLFSVYHTVKYKELRTSVDVVSYLYDADINIKFLLTVLVITICAIVILKYGKIDVNRDKTNISNMVFALVPAAFFLIAGSIRFKELYGVIPVEQLIFHLMAPKTGANFNIVYNFIVKTLFDTAVLFILLAAFLFTKVTFRKSGRIFFSTPSKKIQRIAAVSFTVLSAAFFFVHMRLPLYIASWNQLPSKFYEEYYIDPETVEIIFPERKRNLIVIFVESLETGFLAEEDGGAFSEHLMPGVKGLIRENINFSASAGPGGAHQLYGTEWTIAGIVAQYSGVPLAVPFLNKALGRNSFATLKDAFLPGAFCVGDILNKAGYKSYFILGSGIEFAGRDKYFATHKNTIIYDYHYFLDNGYVPGDYRVWWGIEDRKLYSLTKEKITEIAGDEPFFITFLTADTHPVEMFLDADAANKFDSRQKNVIYDMDRQLLDFIEWLKQQPFYENTTVVISGDHLYQDSAIFPKDFQIHSFDADYSALYYEDRLDNQYKRFPIDIFINSLLSGEYTKNRLFSHFDMFPALVDSIGGVYNAPGLGLGRSMHKGDPTLLESLGVDAVNDALQQRSEYYNHLW